MEKLVADLRSLFDASDHINTETVRQLLEDYKSDRNDWQKYAHFDAHKYTRNLVDIGNGKYNLMILCWGPGMASSIHDHTNSHCFVKVLHGQLLETRYAWPEVKKVKNSKNSPESDEEVQEMVKIGADMYNVNEVTYMSDQLGLHRMENPSHSEPTITLHLYIPPYSQCQVFDERTGRRGKVTVTFYTKFGEKVDYKHSKEGRLIGQPCNPSNTTPTTIPTIHAEPRKKQQ